VHSRGSPRSGTQAAVVRLAVAHPVSKKCPGRYDPSGSVAQSGRETEHDVSRSMADGRRGDASVGVAREDGEAVDVDALERDGIPLQVGRPPVGGFGGEFQSLKVALAVTMTVETWWRPRRGERSTLASRSTSSAKVAANSVTARIVVATSVGCSTWSASGHRARRLSSVLGGSVRLRLRGRRRRRNRLGRN